MKTIGQILNSARLEKKITIASLEDLTKIKSSFIDLIEKGSWDELPPFPTVLGFVKSLATSLGIDEKLAVATLKRDYPPKKIRIVPKPDVANKLLWSPKLTFTIGISIILIIFFGYLVVQYFKFTSAPKLFLESPKEGQIVATDKVNVFGVTDADVKIVINNQPVLVDGDGKFSYEIDVSNNTTEIEVVAVSRSGKETTVRRKIEVE